MQFFRFRIKNFRGIQDLTIDLDRSPQASVFTIVGLNESGKSTILDALGQMGRKAMNLSARDPERTGTSSTQYQSFIPVSSRFNFNGTIELQSVLKFSPGDKRTLETYLSNEFGVVAQSIDDKLQITKKIHYKNSDFQSVQAAWSIDPVVRKPRGKKYAPLSHLLGHKEWLQFANHIEATMLPHILYFKSEVFDFPNKITISTKETTEKPTRESRTKAPSSETNRFYCTVIEDILHAIDPQMTIQQHLVARKRSNSAKDNQNLAALLNEISSHVTRTVMAQWEMIFQRRLSDKRIVATCDLDEDESIYLQFKVQDGGQLFDIRDRSAGFRWFFSFIVLTQYRAIKVDSALFLYDEPASNLHAAAQKQLIDCFRSMPKHFKAIYTTHSHYLINPDWLDATLIARNLGITLDSDSLDFDATKTNIHLTPYRRFVSENPSQISYFQPVLDVLQYSPSRLDPIKPCVLLEGKNDFYGLKYLLTVCQKADMSYDLIPCGGSGTVDQLIALYTGWGKNFLVLLDSDNAGTSEKNRYIDKFGALVKGRIMVYADIDASWQGLALEKVVGKSDLQVIQNAIFPDTKYDKKYLFLAIQELLIKGTEVVLARSGAENLAKINAYLAARCNAA